MITERYNPEVSLFLLMSVFVATGAAIGIAAGLFGGAQAGVLAFLFVLAIGFLLSMTAGLVAMLALDIQKADARG